MPLSNRLIATLKRTFNTVKSGDALRAVLTACKRGITKTKRAAHGFKCWFQGVDWAQLFHNIRVYITNLMHAACHWMTQHPGLTAIVVVCLAIAVVVPIAYGPVLGAAGFSAAGPVAGSVAAGIQAMLGSVAAGSAFAVLQSAAMGGYGVAMLVTVVPAVATAAAAAAFLWTWLRFEGC